MKRQFDEARQVFVSEGQAPPVKVVKSTGVSIQPGVLLDDVKHKPNPVLKRERGQRFAGLVGGFNRPMKRERNSYVKGSNVMKTQGIRNNKEAILIDECFQDQNINLVDDQIPLKMNFEEVGLRRKEKMNRGNANGLKNEAMLIEIDKIRNVNGNVNEYGLRDDTLNRNERLKAKFQYFNGHVNDTGVKIIKKNKSKEDLINLEAAENDLIKKVNQMKLHAQKLLSEKQKFISMQNKHKNNDFSEELKKHKNLQKSNFENFNGKNKTNINRNKNEKFYPHPQKNILNQSDDFSNQSNDMNHNMQHKKNISYHNREINEVQRNLSNLGKREKYEAKSRNGYFAKKSVKRVKTQKHVDNHQFIDLA
jgi:hypothetical protein